MKNRKELLNEEIKKFKKLAGIKTVMKESVIKEEIGGGGPETEVLCGIIDVAARSAESEMFHAKGKNITPTEIKNTIRKSPHDRTPEETQEVREVFDGIFKDPHMVQVATDTFKNLTKQVGWDYVERYVENDFFDLTHDAKLIEQIKNELNTVKPEPIHTDDEFTVQDDQHYVDEYQYEDITTETEESLLEDIDKVEPKKAGFFRKTWQSIKDIFTIEAREESVEGVCAQMDNVTNTLTNQIDDAIKKTKNPKKKASLIKQKNDLIKQNQLRQEQLRAQEIEHNFTLKNDIRQEKLKQERNKTKKSEIDVDLGNLEKKKRSAELHEKRMGIIGKYLKGVLFTVRWVVWTAAPFLIPIIVVQLIWRGINTGKAKLGLGSTNKGIIPSALDVLGGAFSKDTTPIQTTPFFKQSGGGNTTPVTPPTPVTPVTPVTPAPVKKKATW